MKIDAKDRLREDSAGLPPNRQYRLEMYGNYSTVQMPGWNDSDTKSDSVSIRAVYSRLESWLPPDKDAKCLDLGCGHGLLLQTLRGAGYSNLRGVDLGREGIDIARKKGFEVTQGDLREFLRGSNECFDLITAFDVIEHFGKDELLDVLRLILNHLKPGGRFIVQTPNALSPWAGGYRYGDLTHEWIFAPSCITSVLRMVGFHDIQLREVAPYAHGVFSMVRWMLWSVIRMGCALWNFAETGSAQGGIYTRNMVLVAFAGENAEAEAGGRLRTEAQR